MEYLDELGFTGPPPPSAQSRAAAVQALQCCAPGRAWGGDELWAVLLGGAETQTEVSPDRWDVSLYYTDSGPAAGKTNAKHGAFLSSEELTLDSHLFQLPLAEASALVPEQRLVLRVGAACLMQVEEFGRKIHTYVGDCSSESRNYALWPHDGFHHRGTAGAVTANRLSYCMGLQGECCAFDTACSSSLVALSHGCHALAQRRPRAAASSETLASGVVVLGVRVMLGPEGFIGLGAGGFLGIHGRCLTFDSSANGFGRGEGCSAVFLTEETELQMASVLGSAVNQDGRSASMTAPNGPSQQSCIRSSLQMAKISAASLAAMECHGTGTSLGDPIEVGAVAGVMKAAETDSAGLLLTSSKSNIGHGEAVAGLNGFLKCVLMLMNSTCPANVHLRQLNGNLDIAGFPFLFGDELVDGTFNSQQLGVSSFGFGGTNARADLWGHCQQGPHLLRPRLVVVPCPRCQQSMCRSCGEVADDFLLDFHRCEAEMGRRATAAQTVAQCLDCQNESD